jgi:NhaP-type Na+/H+ or K+/H+ antiporter
MINFHNDWAILAVFAFIYSIIAGRLGRTWISDAMVFVAFGLLCGPYGLGVLHLSVNSENLRLIAELTLALVLFIDAANANLTVLKSTVRLPCRLLLVGLPLTILVGFGVGRLLFPDFSLLEAAILATMLAPTDAALGKAVVSNPQVPTNIREDLNVESGLNDGICVPILLALLAFATNQNTEGSTSQLLLHLFTEEIGIGVLVGASLVVLGIQLAKFAIERNWLSETWQQASVPTLAIALIIVATPKMNNLSSYHETFLQEV